MSSTYLVRAIGTTALVGVFVVQHLVQLWEMVDENDDPYGYEYTRLKTGAVLFTKPIPMVCIDGNPDSMCDRPECEYCYPPKVSVGICIDALTAFNHNRWTPFPDADKHYARCVALRNPD